MHAAKLEMDQCQEVIIYIAMYNYITDSLHVYIRI